MVPKTLTNGIRLRLSKTQMELMYLIKLTPCTTIISLLQIQQEMAQLTVTLGQGAAAVFRALVPILITQLQQDLM